MAQIEHGRLMFYTASLGGVVYMGVDGVRRWAPSKEDAQAQASAIAVMVLGEADGAGPRS